MIVVERIALDATAHRITIGSHEIVVDMNAEDGGRDAGPNPHDLYDAALGACKALTMLWYAERHAIPLEGVRVGIARDASEERQGIYRLTARVAIDGPMTAEQRAALIGVADKCPIHKLMTQVETRIETIGVDSVRPLSA